MSRREPTRPSSSRPASTAPRRPRIATGTPATDTRSGTSPRPATTKPAWSADPIEEVQEQCETYTRRIETEKRRQEQLEKKLRISRKKLDESRAKAGGRDEVSVRRSLTRAVGKAEGRREHMLSRLAKQEATNREMRLRIESLRRDRLQRIQIRKQLRQELDAVEEELAALDAERSSIAERKDSSQREIQTLEQAIERERKEVESALEGRAEDAKEASEGGKLGALFDATTGGDDPHGSLVLHMGAEDEHQGLLTIAQERELRHRSTRSLWQIARRERELQARAKALRSHEEAFALIQRGTGIRSVDEMVSAFLAAEDRHFALVGLMHGAQKETEELELECAALEEARGLADSQGSAAVVARRRVFHALEQQTARLQSLADDYDERHESAVRYLDAVRPVAQSILQKVGAGEEVGEGVGGDGSVLQTLAVIERRIEDLARSIEVLGQRPGGAERNVEGSLPGGLDDATSPTAPHAAPPTHATMVSGLDVLATPVGGLGGGEGATLRKQPAVQPPVFPRVGEMLVPGLSGPISPEASPFPREGDLRTLTIEDQAPPTEAEAVAASAAAQQDAEPVHIHHLRERVGLARWVG